MSILKYQNQFENFTITYSDFPTPENYFKIGIQIIKNGMATRFVSHFICLTCAQLLTSLDVTEVQEGIKMYEEAMTSHIKRIQYSSQ